MVKQKVSSFSYEFDSHSDDKYSTLKIMAKLAFEKRIINSILNIICKNIDYLTLPENLPQLAKLGYMYDKLWYAGRVAYGYDGIIRKSHQCENNPKYKLEYCDIGTEEQFDLIYDAWGMHSENRETNFEDFKNLILNGKVLTQLEIDIRKPNKTLDDWVTIKLNPNYKYKSLYPDRKSVLNNLLCTIGTEYSYKDGYIYEEASGAGKDVSIYGHWENAIFDSKIQKIVDKILLDEDVEKVVNTQYNEHIKWKKDKKDKEIKTYTNMYETLFKNNDISLEDFLNKMFNDEITYKDNDSYKKYYPISEYSNIQKIDENSHISYIKGSVEICKDILEHKIEESERGNGNIKFAENFLSKTFIQKYL